MVRKHSGTNQLTARQRRIITTFDGGEQTPAKLRGSQPLKGIGQRLAAARRAGTVAAGPNHLLKPLNLLRKRQRTESLDEPAWERLVAELAVLLPKNQFIVPSIRPHLGMPIAWAFQAIDDLASRGKKRKANEWLISHYVGEFDAKKREAFNKVEKDGPPPPPLLSVDTRRPKPTEANIERMLLGFNCNAAKQAVLEFGHAPPAWRRRLRICVWRRCQRYYVRRGTSPTCCDACAASLSRERKRVGSTRG